MYLPTLVDMLFELGDLFLKLKTASITCLRDVIAGTTDLHCDHIILVDCVCRDIVNAAFVVAEIISSGFWLYL